jgi:hypothetical protein
MAMFCRVRPLAAVERLLAAGAPGAAGVAPGPPPRPGGPPGG